MIRWGGRCFIGLAFWYCGGVGKIRFRVSFIFWFFNIVGWVVNCRWEILMIGRVGGENGGREKGGGVVVG